MLAGNEANGRKLITACLAIHLNGEPFLAAKFMRVDPLDRFWLQKLVQVDQFWQVFCHNR